MVVADAVLSERRMVELSAMAVQEKQELWS